MNKTHTGKKLIAFGLLFLLSIAIYMAYIFLEHQIPFGSDVRRGMTNLMITIVLFVACCFVNYDVLGGLNRLLYRRSLQRPPAAVILTGALCLLCGAFRFAGMAFDVNWTAVGRRLFIVLCLLYLLARGPLTAELLEKSAPFRIIQAFVLCVLSKLMFGGFAAAGYVVIAFAVSDFLSVCMIDGSKSGLGLWLRTFAACFVPILLVYYVTLGYKYFVTPDILALQGKLLNGEEVSFSLGPIADVLQNSVHSYLLLFLLATLCVVVAGLLLIPLGSVISDLQSNAIALTSIFFLLALSMAVLQYVLNVDLIARFLPGAYPVTGVITALLANSVLNCKSRNDQPTPTQQGT